MYSKVVARQLEEARDISLAVGKNAEKVAISLQQRLVVNNAEPGAIDWKLVLDALGKSLLETTESLVEQDSEYQVQLLLAKQGRERRDAAMEKVRNQLRGARFLLDQAFGREKASGYFPERSELGRLMPRNLMSLARSIARVLRGTEVDWPSLEGEIHVPQPQALASAMEAATNDLEAALLALSPERSGTAFARGTKRAELVATQRSVSSTTAALSGLFRVAGFDYYARQLRPSTRRSGKTPGEASPPPPPAPAPPASSPPVPSSAV